MDETLKEIESRIGAIHGSKFVKSTTEDAKSRWYTANYNNAKVRLNE